MPKEVMKIILVLYDDGTATWESGTAGIPTEPHPPIPDPDPPADGIIGVVGTTDQVSLEVAWDESLQPGTTEWRVNLINSDTGQFVDRCKDCQQNPTWLTAPREAIDYPVHIDVVGINGTPRERIDIDRAVVPALGSGTAPAEVDLPPSSLDMDPGSTSAAGRRKP